MSRDHKSEERIQQECYMWFNNDYPELRGLLFHVPNGGARAGKEGKKLKLVGVVPGVSDLILLYNSKPYCFELKNDYGRQSINQREWEKKVNKQNINYRIITSLKEFQFVIKKIIK